MIGDPNSIGTSCYDLEVKPSGSIDFNPEKYLAHANKNQEAQGQRIQKMKNIDSRATANFYGA